MDDEIREAINAGDARLRDHIDQGITRLALAAAATATQVEIALKAAELLELERIHRLEQRLDASAGELRATAATATEEREKAAAAALVGIDQHIAALEGLFDGRLRELAARIESESELFRLLRDADATAITKANETTEERFKSANEWRAQSADRERTQAEAHAVLTATFMRTDTADARFTGLRASIESQVSELRRLVTDLNSKISKVV
jgi:chromosome segregation ATPase